MKQRICAAALCAALLLTAISPAFAADEIEYDEYGNIIVREETAPADTAEVKEQEEAGSGGIVLQDDVRKYIEEFNKLPLWKRTSSMLQYPASMETFFSKGRTVPVRAEEYERLTRTPLAPFINVYHMTTEQQVFQGIGGGEYGQLIFAIAESPYDPSLLLMGNDTSGIYRSEDGGKTWRSSSDGLFVHNTNYILFDPDDENTVYAAMAGGANKGRFHCVGIYKSTDKGRHWEMMRPLNNVKRVGNMLAFGPKNKAGERMLYAASGDSEGHSTTGKGYTGIYRSPDRGVTWESIGFTDKNTLNLTMVEEQDLLIASVEGVGLVVSRDQGTTWEARTNGLPALTEAAPEQKGDQGYQVHGLVLAENEVVDVAVDPADSSHWFAGTYSIRLFESFDSGASWKEVSMDVGLPEVAEDGFLRKLHFGRARENAPARLFINMYRTTETVRFSDDFGRSFQIPDYHQEKSYFLKKWHTGWFAEAIAFSPTQPGRVYTGRGSTFRVSTNGGTDFYPSSSGYSGAAAYDWVFDAKGALRYVGMIDTGLWRMAEGYEGDYIPMMDAGVNQPPAVGDGKCVMGIATDPNDPLHMVASYGGGLYGRESALIETFDGFETSHIIQEVYDICMLRTEQGLGRMARVNKFVSYHAQNPNVIYTNWFRSYDNGKTWLENEIEIRGICGPDNDILYGLKDMGVYASYDRGDTWFYSGITLPIPVAARARAAFGDQFEAGVFWVAEFSNVYRVDLKTGSVKATGAANGIVTRTGQRLECIVMAQNPKDGAHIFLAARDANSSAWNHVFETRDGGRTWADIEGLPKVTGASMLKFHPTKDQLYMGTMMGTIVYEFGAKRKAEAAAQKTAENTGGDAR